MCEALRDSEPLAATPVADAVAQFRGKRVERDKYDDDTAYAAKVAGMAARFPDLMAPRAVSFRLDEDRIGYHPTSQEMTFPVGPVSDSCSGIRFGDDGPGIPVCASEVVSSAQGKPYSASNAFGARATIDVRETAVAGIYLGNEAASSPGGSMGKSPRAFDRSFGFRIAPDVARAVSRDAELVIVFVPRAPFFITGSDGTSPTIDMPREERVAASYVAGDVACSAIRYKASRETLVYRAAGAGEAKGDGGGLSRTAMPRGSVAGWLTSRDGPFAQLGLNLLVGPSGSVTKCWGDGKNADQEGKACALVTRRARFSPAIDMNGQPVTQLYRFEVGAMQ